MESDPDDEVHIS